MATGQKLTGNKCESEGNATTDEDAPASFSGPRNSARAFGKRRPYEQTEPAVFSERQ